MIGNKSIKSIKLSKPVLTILSIISVIIIVTLVVIYKNYPPLPEKVAQESMKLLDTGIEPNIVINSIKAEYKIKDDNKTSSAIMFKKQYESRFQETLLQFKDKIQSKVDAIEEVTGKNKIKIEKVKIDKKSYKSDYVDINTTVKNVSDTDINYVKINIYCKDKEGKIVNSTYTNDVSCIKSGATQTLTKMIKNDNTWTEVSAEISEAH